MLIKADNKVPPPKHATKGKPRGPWRYPWVTMEVGQSFLIPADVVISHFRRAAWDAGRKYDRTFSVRKVEDGYRCFRLL